MVQKIVDFIDPEFEPDYIEKHNGNYEIVNELRQAVLDAIGQSPSLAYRLQELTDNKVNKHGLDRDFDASDYRIRNIADPENDGDAVSKRAMVEYVVAQILSGGDASEIPITGIDLSLIHI